MRMTVFSTPLLTPALRWLARRGLRLLGWKAIGTPHHVPKYVLIGAPHTSNWDFPLMLMVVLDLRLKVFWMGKDSLFPFPLAWFMKWLGGIPIDRSAPRNRVMQTVAQYHAHDELVILVPPEGTRSKVDTWKTGFYHIARNAGIPILLGYVDAARKEAGFADFFYPSGDVEADMTAIRAFYADKRGLLAENS